MSVRKIVTEVIMTIKSAYPNYKPDGGPDVVLKIWETVLRDYSDDEINAALFKCVQNCKFVPTPADLVEYINLCRIAALPTPEELWCAYYEMLIKGARLYSCFNYTAMDDNGRTQGQNARAKAEKLWEDAPDEVKRQIGSYGEFIRRAKDYCYNSRSLDVEQQRFVTAVSQRREIDIRLGNIPALPDGYVRRELLS